MSTEITRMFANAATAAKAADELREGLGKSEFGNQRIDRIGVPIAVAPVEHGFERGNAGRDPGKAMRGALVIRITRRQRRAGGIAIGLRGGEVLPHQSSPTGGGGSAQR